MNTVNTMQIGDSFEIKKIITNKDVEGFAKVSGDNNPIHLDDSVAKKSIFKKRIAHGMLTASIFSSIFGNEFPGFGTIYLGQNLHFLKPVFLNEEIRARVTVIGKNIKNNTLKMKTECFNSKNEKVIDGEAFLKPPISQEGEK